MSDQLTFFLTDKTLTDLINLQENGQLSLPWTMRSCFARAATSRKVLGEA